MMLDVPSPVGRSLVERGPTRGLQKESTPDSSDSVASTPPIRVLLVDDEPSLLQGTARLLFKAGHMVVAVSNGEQAIKVIETPGTFDVIVSDIRMPKMDGLSLLRAVRARDLDIPVIFMTGSPTLETAVEAIENGAYQYLVRPIEGKVLSASVIRAAKMHRLAVVRRALADELGTPAIGDRAGLESRYASAVEKMWIAMQPVLSWRKRSVFAYEALLRTEEPALRNPLDFLDAAERLGRTAELGRLARKCVADQIPYAPPLAKIFVNLHPTDLVDEELGSSAGALSPFAHRVVLEVTERAALEKVPGVTAAVLNLRKLGFGIALDDLGAGYAGLSSFALLEPEIVKVDMSLIRGIHQSPVKQKVFSSIATLCRDLGVQIVAEGVEVAEERECLDGLGGDLYQGYLFARPGRGFPPAVF
jgi:EAL domain-containing protein (putative c-di-GMP-specific phosphodiesterase class I)